MRNTKCMNEDTLLILCGVRPIGYTEHEDGCMLTFDDSDDTKRVVKKLNEKLTGTPFGKMGYDILVPLRTYILIEKFLSNIKRHIEYCGSFELFVDCLFRDIITFDVDDMFVEVPDLIQRIKDKNKRIDDENSNTKP